MITKTMKTNYFIPIKGNSNYDICMCMGNCNKDCIRNLNKVKHCEQYYSMADFTNNCVSYEEENPIKKNY